MQVLEPYAIWILFIFVIGYLSIILEHFIKINKTTSALLMAIAMWTLLFFNHTCVDKSNLDCFQEKFGGMVQIIFFILGALSIVELINIHQGFAVISNYINVASKRKLLWIMGFITFFLSSVLDNLTTTIVMITLLMKLLPKSEDRLIIGGGIVIAANAGGAWTPIGDVTTTMLWIGGRLTTHAIMLDLFIPSLVCLLVSLFLLSFPLKGSYASSGDVVKEKVEPYGKSVLLLGVACLIFVPIFKTLTGLPPFMGILLGLGVLWVYTDIVHRGDEREHLKVPAALARIDLSSAFFFLGILLCIDALDVVEVLKYSAYWLDNTIGNISVIATLTGIFSAVIDNVPLVAASMGMYSLSQHPVDSQFWELIAFCAGTGGSILVIGSAAGVVYMGLEKVNFFWYLKKISFPALLGYLGGIAVYLLIDRYSPMYVVSAIALIVFAVSSVALIGRYRTSPFYFFPKVVQKTE